MTLDLQSIILSMKVLLSTYNTSEQNLLILVLLPYNMRPVRYKRILVSSPVVNRLPVQAHELGRETVSRPTGQKAIVHVLPVPGALGTTTDERSDRTSGREATCRTRQLAGVTARELVGDICWKKIMY